MRPAFAFAFLMLSLMVDNYDVRYTWGRLDTRVATAAISWQDTLYDKVPACHATAVVRTTPIFHLFLGSDYYAEIYFNRGDHSPLYFINPFTSNGKDCKHECVYRTDKGIIEATSIRSKGEPEHKTFPLDGRTMDLFTLMPFVRFLDLQPADEPLHIQVLIASKPYPAEIRNEGPDNEKFPGTPAERFLILMTEHGLMENGSGNEIHLWRSAAPDHRLLALETDLSVGHMAVRLRGL